MTQVSLLASKPRFEILDGLRGVAAVIVVVFHLFEPYSDPAHQLLNHGYLAVDFFYVLSGFVIGYAYDDRWHKMTIKDFFKRRLVRLHPLLIMGNLLGAILFYFGASSAWPLIENAPCWKVLLLFLLGCTMLPALTSWDIRGQQETHPFNGPSWSLLYEYIGNILYALIIHRFSKTVLTIFVIGSAFFILDLSLNLDVFGLLASRSPPTHYTVIGGWCITPTQVYIGFTRLLYPLLAGLLVFRMNKLIKVTAGFWWCSLLITIILVMPRIGGGAHAWWNGAYEAFCILIVCPVIVAMGAGSTITGKRSVDLCQFLGEISYPLYITHYPFIYLQTAWIYSHPDASLGTTIFLNVSTFVMAVGTAYACLKLYDIPVRAWLQKRYLLSTHTEKTPKKGTEMQAPEQTSVILFTPVPTTK